MLKSNPQQITLPLKNFLRQLLAKTVAIIPKAIAAIKQADISFWKMIFGILAILLLLYYGIGGLIINNIDTSSSYQPKNKDNSLSVIDMSSHLINREVYHKIWTPNLPFMFPSYFLDNMPNFQLGLMSAISKTISVFPKLIITYDDDASMQNLSEAAELLQYPGNIWLFSSDNRLAPSSSTQYKKGRKKLNQFNQEIAQGRIIFQATPDNLLLILAAIKSDISKQIIKTDTHIREYQKSLIDNKSDDIFYYDLGKLYGYFQILKALGDDFKDILVKEDVYQQWTALLKNLEMASDLNPSIVRNGKLNSSFAPNHLAAINYFASRSINILGDIINRLK